MPPQQPLPRIELGSWPTPVRQMTQTSAALGVEVWVKSEESCGTWGGNKVRKLEYILGALERRRSGTIVTYGAGTSSWAAAVALHAAPRGWRVRLGLGGPVPDVYERLYAETNTIVHARGSYALLPIAAVEARIAAGIGNVVRLPAGGSGLPGDVGSMHAGQEIAEQVSSGALPVPDAVYVPAGTSGTAAGIAVGMSSRGLNRPVVAVRVTPRPFGTDPVVKMRALRLAGFLERHGYEPGAGARLVRGDGRFFAPAYGAGNAASHEAIEIARRDDVELDPTYAAKAFAALTADARSRRTGPVLFVHTSPGPLPAPV